MENLFALVSTVFDRTVVFRQIAVKYIVVPVGIVTLPGLIVLKFVYLRLLKNFIDTIWRLMCRLYVRLVDTYNGIHDNDLLSPRTSPTTGSASQRDRKMNHEE
jgi:hypothetical protein